MLRYAASEQELKQRYTGRSVTYFLSAEKILLTKKNEYDFAEIDFLVQTRIDQTSEHVFRKHMRFGDNIREIIIRFCPNMDETDKELIPYMAVSLLEGASIRCWWMEKV